jgi:hypothetical protein
MIGRRIALCCVAVAATSAFAQSGKVFGYDGTAQQQNNPLLQAIRNALQQKKQKLVGSFLHVSGNFGGVLTVSGPAIGTSPAMVNTVTIESSVPFVISARGFGSILGPNRPDQSIGSVQYEMALYAVTGNSRGLISGPVKGIDGVFNGARLEALGNGTTQTFELVITRSVSLTQMAMGGVTYRSTGSLDLELQ